MPFEVLRRQSIAELERDVESRLRALMRDPLYWKRRDPDFTAHVGRQFDRVFGTGPVQHDATGRMIQPRAVRFDLEAFRPPPRREDLRLAAPVGPGARNRPGDVIGLKKTLAGAGLFELDPILEPSERVGEGFVGAIRDVQAGLGLEPDGLVTPGGPTATALQTLLFGESSEGKGERAAGKGPEAARAAPAAARRVAEEKARDPLRVRTVDTAANGSETPEVEEIMVPRARQTTPKDSVDAAERRLRLGIGLTRRVGLKNAADNLEHFLDGGGKPRAISREEARKRSFIAGAEEKNRGRFAENFLRPRPDNPDFDYQKHLRVLKDGRSVRLPIKQGKPGDHEDHFDVEESTRDNLLGGELDEALATGTSQLESIAEKGFVATRKGNMIHLEGVVEHRWKDRYDFEPGASSSEDALLLQKSGRARPFDSEAAWRQRMTGTIEIENGRLTNPRFRWEDMD